MIDRDKAVSAAARRAKLLVQSGHLPEGLKRLEQLAAEAATLYADENDLIVRDFYNLYEHVLFIKRFKPQKTVVHSPVNRADIFKLYGYCLTILKRYTEAKTALKTALSFNPVSTNVLFEYGELFKLLQDWKSFLKIIRRCLLYAHTPQEIARAYRNLGLYYTHVKKYLTANALYCLSAEYESSPVVEPELSYIQQQTGETHDRPSAEEIGRLFEAESIQIGPSPLAIRCLKSIIEGFEEEGDRKGALRYAQSLYNIDKSRQSREILYRLWRK